MWPPSLLRVEAGDMERAVRNVVPVGRVSDPGYSQTRRVGQTLSDGPVDIGHGVAEDWRVPATALAAGVASLSLLLFTRAFFGFTGLLRMISRDMPNEQGLHPRNRQPARTDIPYVDRDRRLHVTPEHGTPATVRNVTGSSNLSRRAPNYALWSRDLMAPSGAMEAVLTEANPFPGRWKPRETALIQAVDPSRAGHLRVRYGEVSASLADTAIRSKAVRGPPPMAKSSP